MALLVLILAVTLIVPQRPLRRLVDRGAVVFRWRMCANCILGSPYGVFADP
jgi:hypothetical protein